MLSYQIICPINWKLDIFQTARLYVAKLISQTYTFIDLFKALAIDKPPLINVFLRMRCIKMAINVQGDSITHTF